MKLLGRYLLLCLAVTACSKPVHHKDPVTMCAGDAVPVAQAVVQPTKPMLFARYDAIELERAQLDSNKQHAVGANTIAHVTENCKSSKFFHSQSNSARSNRVDFCAPSPTQWTDKSSAPTKEAGAWELPRSPASFYWQQPLAADERFTVEIRDSRGLPWPATTTMHHQDGFQIIEVTPSIGLPKNATLYVVANLFDKSGSKKETWLQKLGIADGDTGNLPWVARADKAR